MNSKRCPEYTEAQDDRDFRKHMGEIECPNCGRPINDSSDCDYDDVDRCYRCGWCGASLEE